MATLAPLVAMGSLAPIGHILIKQNHWYQVTVWKVEAISMFLWLFLAAGESLDGHEAC